MVDRGQWGTVGAYLMREDLKSGFNAVFLCNLEDLINKLGHEIKTKAYSQF